MNEDLKTPKEEKNLVLIIEDANTQLKKILNDALLYAYNRAYTKSLVSELIMKKVAELKEAEAPEDLIKSFEIGIKQSFLRQYTFILVTLSKRKKQDKSGVLAMTLRKMKSQVPLDIQAGGGMVLEVFDESIGIVQVEVNNLRDYMTEIEAAAGGRYVDYADMVQEAMIEIGDKIADGSITETDKLGRQKSLRNMAEITVRYQLIVDDVKKMGKDVKYVIASSHPNASERCSWWQGKIFLMDIDVATREMGEYKLGTTPPQDIKGYIDGKPYYSLKQACENGFLSYNCQHRLIKYYKGVKAPEYNIFQVNGARNITTRQRVLENRIRQYKAREELYTGYQMKKSLFDPYTQSYQMMTPRKQAQLMSKYWTEQYRAFSKRMGAPTYEWRLRITEPERMVRGL